MTPIEHMALQAANNEELAEECAMAGDSEGADWHRKEAEVLRRRQSLRLAHQMNAPRSVREVVR